MIGGTPQYEKDPFLAESLADRARDYSPMFEFRDVPVLGIASQPAVVEGGGLSSLGEPSSANAATPAGELNDGSLVECAGCGRPIAGPVHEISCDSYCANCAAWVKDAVHADLSALDESDMEMARR